jgi:hypothetical protein
MGAPALEPFPVFTGRIGMRELQAARRLLDQGLELDRIAQRHIIDRAIELEASQGVPHDESCTWWLGAACDCPESRR